MSDSYISHGPDGTSYVGPDATQLFRAGQIRMALRLWQKGIKMNRQTRLRWLLLAASGYTGKTYKNKDIGQAVDDLSVWMSVMRSALPEVS